MWFGAESCLSSNNVVFKCIWDESRCCQNPLKLQILKQKAERFFIASVTPAKISGEQMKLKLVIAMFSYSMRLQYPKSLLGVDYNGILVWVSLSLLANWIQSHESGLSGWTINSRGNERCLSSCGYCAPDQDRGINTAWTNPRSRTNQTLKSSKHRNIIQQRKDVRKSELNHCDPFEIREAEETGSKNRQRDRSRKPLCPCQSIVTVVRRSACNSGGCEHHLYGCRSGGHWSNQVGGSWLSELVSSAERQAGTVMRIMTS